MNSDWLRDPRPEDVDLIGLNLREADLIECLAQGRDGPATLQRGLDNSDHVQTITWKGEPVGMLGVCPGGFIWLLGTNEMTEGACSIRLLRECSKTLTAVHQLGYRLLGNVTWVGNHVHHKWLSWLGFTIDRKLPVSVGGMDHFYFWRTSDV